MGADWKLNAQFEVPGSEGAPKWRPGDRMDDRLTRSRDLQEYQFTGFTLPEDSTTAVGYLLWRGIAMGEDGKPVDVYFRSPVTIPEPGWNSIIPDLEYMAERLEIARLSAEDLKRDVEASNEIFYHVKRWNSDDETEYIPEQMVKILAIHWVDDYQYGERAGPSQYANFFEKRI